MYFNVLIEPFIISYAAINLKLQYVSLVYKKWNPQLITYFLQTCILN